MSGSYYLQGDTNNSLGTICCIGAVIPVAEYHALTQPSLTVKVYFTCFSAPTCFCISCFTYYYFKDRFYGETQDDIINNNRHSTGFTPITSAMRSNNIRSTISPQSEVMVNENTQLTNTPLLSNQ